MRLIYLSEDIAYGYDAIAIASIKAERYPNTQTKANYNRRYREVQDQIGELLHLDVICSPEYNALRKVNEEMFIRIDEMKARPRTGEDTEYIDSRVYARQMAKQALQQKWFGSDITETKHGYTGQPMKATT